MKEGGVVRDVDEFEEKFMCILRDLTDNTYMDVEALESIK